MDLCLAPDFFTFGLWYERKETTKKQNKTYKHKIQDKSVKLGA